MSGTEDMNSPAPDSRIGFRDIYRAVGESEARITSLINERFGALGKDVSDHETRIRVIEAAVTPLALLAEARDNRLDIMEAQVKLNTARIDTRQAAEHGVLSTLSAGKQLIVVAAAVVGCISGVTAVLSRLVP